jgi:uncharacterized protein YabN with tetrapyrrole methylase and pyrophosphatase domain
VFGSVQADTAGEVLRNWDQIKRGEPGFDQIAETLPATIYAGKVQRRAGMEVKPDLRRSVAALEEADDRDARFEALGQLMFEIVAIARELGADPELALRAAADRAQTPST